MLGSMREPTDFGSERFPAALVNVTNVCNLSCEHCFVFRADNPNRPRDRMDEATMLAQLRALRDRHGIESMLFMGGEPMIRRELVLRAMELFPRASIVTNGTYGIPSVPGHLVTVSLDGPEELNDAIRGAGVFRKVRDAVFARDAHDATTVMLQMVVTRRNAPGLEAFVEQVKDWPVEGLAFTFYVPTRGDTSAFTWLDLRQRDAVIDRVIALKGRYPEFVKSNVGALELMKSDVCLESTGAHGEHCQLRRMLPLYMGQGGNFERTFCCYGNDVDCTRCGAYGAFNARYRRLRGESGTAGLD
jgi:MoaA/NifB/PqqE/SkfB family radical SAM enzyme